MSAPLVEQLREALGEHVVNYHHHNVGGETAETLRYTSCEGCDWLGGWHDEQGHTAHLADLSARVVEAWLGEQREMMGEAVEDAISDPHSGRLDIADTVLAALRAQIGVEA